MASGTIKTLTDRGFGFIAGEDGVDVFFHRSAVTGTEFDGLRTGDRVTYAAGADPRGKGPRATDVRREEA